MKKYIYATAIILIGALPTAYAGKHQAGNDGGNQSCFYDSKPGKNKWNYYFCGAKTDKCAGKKPQGKNISNWDGKNNDTTTLVKNMEVFTFLTDPKDTYCCCGNTFKKALNENNCYTDAAPKETIKDLGNGNSCKQLTYKTVCGTDKTVDCNTPEETCDTGQKWRSQNKSCAPICSDDEVYESDSSNKCATCETTAHQGISADGTYCIKCNKDTEFFNRKTRTCVKKSTMQAQYSKESMKECWLCPRESGAFTICVKAVTAANKAGITDPTERKKRIKEEAMKITPMDTADIWIQCHLN